MGIIQPLGDLAKHFWLTRSVARSMGVSLSEAMAEGHLSATGYADMVTNCRTCTQVTECEIWLADRAVSTKEAPHCCMHKGILELLAR